MSEVKRVGRQAVFVTVFYPKLGFEALLLDQLRAWIKKSRDQAGCRIFDLYRRPGNSAALYLHEVWENWNSFEAHASSFQTSRFRADVLRYLNRPIEVVQVEEIS